MIQNTKEEGDEKRDGDGDCKRRRDKDSCSYIDDEKERKNTFFLLGYVIWEDKIIQ